MKRIVEERRVNRKLTAITKGPHCQIDRIQVPVHDWFHSEKSKEIYHFDKGVWEAYPMKTPSLYFSHHTLKVLPEDATPITVQREADGIRIESFLPQIEHLWKDITDP